MPGRVNEEIMHVPKYQVRVSVYDNDAQIMTGAQGYAAEKTDLPYAIERATKELIAKVSAE